MSSYEVRNLKKAAEECMEMGRLDHDGRTYDIGRIVKRVIHNCEHRGIAWAIKRYFLRGKR